MARTKLTAGRIREFTCKPGASQSFLWDTDAPGLAVRVASGQRKTFIFQARLDAKVIRIPIGDVKVWDIESNDHRRPGAREEARRLQTLLDNGIDPRQDKIERISAKQAEIAAAQAVAVQMEATVGAAWAAYLVRHKKGWGPRHMADHLNLSQAGGLPMKRGDKLTVKGVLSPLMEMRMVDITSEVLKGWQTKEAETRPNNARQGFEMFRAFWRWCASKDEYKSVIDAQAVESKDLRDEVPSRKNKKFDVLERSHLTLWFSAVRNLNNPIIGAYLQGLVLTGCRREELAELRWQDVDFQWKALWVKDKVAMEGRKIPLTPYLSGLLRALPRRNEWVFSSPGAAAGRITEPRLSHNRALSAAGLPHVTLHGLRRTFASLAEWVEMPRGVVAQLMGHAPNATAEKHYINRPLELLAIWHCKYEAWILEQAGIEQPPVESVSLRVVA